MHSLNTYNEKEYYRDILSAKGDKRIPLYRPRKIPTMIFDGSRHDGLVDVEGLR